MEGRSSTVLKSRRASIQVSALGSPLPESNRDLEPVSANKLVYAHTLVVSFLRPRILNDQVVTNRSIKPSADCYTPNPDSLS